MEVESDAGDAALFEAWVVVGDDLDGGVVAPDDFAFEGVAACGEDACGECE